MGLSWHGIAAWRVWTVAATGRHSGAAGWPHSVISTLLLAAAHSPWCPSAYAMFFPPLHTQSVEANTLPLKTQLGGPCSQVLLPFVLPWCVSHGGCEVTQCKTWRLLFVASTCDTAATSPHTAHLGLVKSSSMPDSVMKSVLITSAPLSASMMRTCACNGGQLFTPQLIASGLL